MLLLLMPGFSRFLHPSKDKSMNLTDFSHSSCVWQQTISSFRGGEWLVGLLPFFRFFCGRGRGRRHSQKASPRLSTLRVPDFCYLSFRPDFFLLLSCLFVFASSSFVLLLQFRCRMSAVAYFSQFSCSLFSLSSVVWFPLSLFRPFFVCLMDVFAFYLLFLFLVLSEITTGLMILISLIESSNCRFWCCCPFGSYY